MSYDNGDLGYLPINSFRFLVGNAPLVSMDLIVCYKGQVLLGRRLNRPAQGAWFVPGGRIRKEERLSDAFHRLCTEELGVAMLYEDVKSLGVYEHFYNDSVFGESPSTHYIAIGSLVELTLSIEDLPKGQHDNFAWWPIREALDSSDVHSYTKDYLHSII